MRAADRCAAVSVDDEAVRPKQRSISGSSRMNHVGRIGTPERSPSRPRSRSTSSNIVTKPSHACALGTRLKVVGLDVDSPNRWNRLHADRVLKLNTDVRLFASDFAVHTNRRLVNHIAWIHNCQVPEQNLIDVYAPHCARAEGVAQLAGRCTLAGSPAGELLPAESSSRHDLGLAHPRSRVNRPIFEDSVVNPSGTLTTSWPSRQGGRNG